MVNNSAAWRSDLAHSAARTAATAARARGNPCGSRSDLSQRRVWRMFSVLPRWRTLAPRGTETRIFVDRIVLEARHHQRGLAVDEGTRAPSSTATQCRPSRVSGPVWRHKQWSADRLPAPRAHLRPDLAAGVAVVVQLPPRDARLPVRPPRSASRRLWRDRNGHVAVSPARAGAASLVGAMRPYRRLRPAARRRHRTNTRLWTSESKHTPVSASWPTRRLACPQPARDVIRAGAYLTTRAYDVPRDVIRTGCAAAATCVMTSPRATASPQPGSGAARLPGMPDCGRGSSTGCPHGVHAVRRDRARRVGARRAGAARAPQRGRRRACWSCGPTASSSWTPSRPAPSGRSRPPRSSCRRPAGGRGRRARARLHDARGARRLPGREVRRRRDRAGAGRLDARRHRSRTARRCWPTSGSPSWSPTSRSRSPRPGPRRTTWSCSTSTTAPATWSTRRTPPSTAPRSSPPAAPRCARAGCW